jgi:hypothetical protein
MSSIMELGIQSYKDLGGEFVAAVFGLGPTGKTSVVCGAGEDDINILKTYFYLNPYGEGVCSGSDWTGEWKLCASYR